MGLGRYSDNRRFRDDCDVAVRYIGKGEKVADPLKKFIAEQYSKRYVLLNDVLRNWQFGGDIRTVSVGNDIVGMVGEIKVSMKVWNDSCNCVFLANLMVKKESRALGLGARLVRDSMKEHGMCYALNMTPEVVSMYEKLGWKRMPYLKRFVKVLNVEKVKKLARIEKDR